VAVALDADAIIGFLDRSDALHRSALELVGRAAAGDVLVTSAVTLAEVLTAARLGHHDEGLVRGFFDDLIGAVIPVDADVADAAAWLRSKNPLRMPDALVLATAMVQPDVAALITGAERLAKAPGPDLRVQLLEGGGGRVGSG